MSDLPTLHLNIQAAITLANHTLPHADDSYAVLKAYGHSPAKAAEIALDARRGDVGCQRWIELARKSLKQGDAA